MAGRSAVAFVAESAQLAQLWRTLRKRHRGGWRGNPRRMLVALALSAMVVAGAGVSMASADTVPPADLPGTVSADALPTWQIDGVVWSQVLVRNTVYVTGSFAKARPPGVSPGGPGEVYAQNIFAYDISTGGRVAGFQHALNGQGLAITASPDGSRIFVGGDFTTVDGELHNHLVAFRTDTGAVDTAFTSGVNSQVRALTATSTTLFVGGKFSTWSDKGTTASRIRLAALNIANGALLTWRPKADATVWSMVVSPDASRVIVGGSFTTLAGQPAYGMGSVSASTGTALPWAANQTIRNATSTGAITSLRTDGTQIYGSGYAYGEGSSFEGTFAADPDTGEITVVNDCHGDTYDVLPLGPVLYSVGHPHDCRWVGSFPDVSPRRWQYALAQTKAAVRKNTGPDDYGWNYDGLPASKVLHWFPDFTAGTYTGQYQAGWSIAGNANYVVMGGEFTKVNGTPQQGLVRMAVSAIAPDKRGPSYSTKPTRPVPATTAAPAAPGRVTVTFGTAWDYDNELLSYEVFRDAEPTPVSRVQVKSNFWTLPTKSFTDTGLGTGSQHRYKVRISDPFGNSLTSPTSNTVTVS